MRRFLLAPLLLAPQAARARARADVRLRSARGATLRRTLEVPVPKRGSLLEPTK